MNTIAILAALAVAPAAAWNGVTLDETYDPYTDATFDESLVSTPQLDTYGTFDAALIATADVIYGPLVSGASCMNTFQVAPDVALNLAYTGARYDLDAFGLAFGDGIADVQLTTEGVSVTLLGEDGGYDIGLSNMCDGDLFASTKEDKCYFQHVCKELCKPRTAGSTAGNYRDGGSGYVLGCIVAEAYFRWTASPIKE